MNLSPTQITAVSQWHEQSSRRQKPELKEVQIILGLKNGCIALDDYALDGHFAHPIAPADFDTDYIEDELTADRYNELSEGATPTEEETALWKEKKEGMVFEEDGWWYHFYLWRVDLSEATIYFRSLHGDGGTLDAFDGPFNNEQEALEEAANLELNPPD